VLPKKFLFVQFLGLYKYSYAEWTLEACRSPSNTSHFLFWDLGQATFWCLVMLGAFQPSVADGGSAFPWLGITLEGNL